MSGLRFPNIEKDQRFFKTSDLTFVRKSYFVSSRLYRRPYVSDFSNELCVSRLPFVSFRLCCYSSPFFYSDFFQTTSLGPQIVGLVDQGTSSYPSFDPLDIDGGSL